MFLAVHRNIMYVPSFSSAFSFIIPDRVFFSLDCTHYDLVLTPFFRDLTRRGLFRTAFEFARLMYSMDPWEDPHGSLFWLDWLALRSGMHQWLLDAIQVWERLGGNSDEKGRKMDSEKVINPALLPGWMYSRALAVKMLEDENTKKGSGSSSVR
jgi:hypothetical protein